MRALSVLLLALAALWSVVPAAATERESRTLYVFAAASLTDAVNEVSTAFTQRTGVVVKCSFASSSVLARQIESGAPAGVFFSADEEWMTYLQKRGRLAPGTRRDVLTNRLALIAPVDSTASVQIASGASLLSVLGNSRIAAGDPDSVPAGRYAEEALTTLGIWKALEPRLVRAENVRVALAYVARGEAPFGIVYRTDAMVEKRVKLLALFPQNSHAPIRYPIAVTRRGGANARRFVAFITADERAAAIFRKYGFSIADSASSGNTSSKSPPGH